MRLCTRSPEPFIPHRITLDSSTHAQPCSRPCSQRSFYPFRWHPTHPTLVFGLIALRSVPRGTTLAPHPHGTALRRARPRPRVPAPHHHLTARIDACTAPDRADRHHPACETVLHRARPHPHIHLTPRAHPTMLPRTRRIMPHCAWLLSCTVSIPGSGLHLILSLCVVYLI